MDKDIRNKTCDEIKEIVSSLDGRPYLAEYIFSFIHAKGATGIDGISTLPKEFRQNLQNNGWYISNLKTVQQFIDPDGTVKFLFELTDGVRVESVLLFDQSRKTLCISSQAGCRMKCSFCATGQLKFSRNLTAAEIADQVNKASQIHGKINNIVYMGMGEPFDNTTEVLRSVSILNHPLGLNIGQRHITISTCGLPEGIKALAESGLQVRLAVSLHAADDAVRNRIMAVGLSYPIGAVLKSVRLYQQKTNRRITFEYCMIKGLNDSPDQARRLSELISGIDANVNLVEYNAHPGCSFAATPAAQIRKFADMLRSAGVDTTIRYKRGRKINAACGQLGSTQLSP